MSETSSEKIIAASVFKSLIKASSAQKAKHAADNGKLGEKIKHHVEHSNLHAGAFGVICRADRMEETRRNDYIRSLRLYLDMAEEHVWDIEEGHTGDMVDDAEDAVEREERENSAAAEENAKKINAGIKPLSDEEAFADQEKDGSGESNLSEQVAADKEWAGKRKSRRGVGRQSATAH